MGHDNDTAREERHYLARVTRRVEYLTFANLGVLSFLLLTQLGTNQEAAGNVLLLAFGGGMLGFLYESEPIYELRKDIRKWWANR